jgi:hypothetical protein
MNSFRVPADAQSWRSLVRVDARDDLQSDAVAAVDWRILRPDATRIGELRLRGLRGADGR